MECAALGTLVNIVQLVEVSIRIISRICEYVDCARNVPDYLPDTVNCLPLYTEYISQLERCQASERLLVAVALIGLKERTESLEREIRKHLPSPTDCGQKRLVMGIMSIRAELNARQNLELRSTSQH